METGGGWRLGRLIGCLTLALLLIATIVIFGVLDYSPSQILGLSPKRAPTPTEVVVSIVREPTVTPVPVKPTETPVKVIEPTPTQVGKVEPKPTNTPVRVEPTPTTVLVKVIEPTPTTQIGLTATAVIEPTQVSEEPSLICSPENTFVYPFDAWLTYYPGIVAFMEKWMESKGYCLQLYPYGISENYPDVPEAERFQKTASGEWDAMPTTWDGFVRFAKEGEMVMTYVLDESDQGDVMICAPEIGRLDQIVDPLNPLYPGRPVRISYSDGSVSQFLLETFAKWFWWGKFGRPDIVRVPMGTTEEAVEAFTNNESDCVVTWYPNSLDALDGRSGAHILPGADTGTFRVIADVLVISQRTINENRPMVDAFLRVFVTGMNMLADDSVRATALITKWEQDLGIDTEDFEQKWSWANSPEEVIAEWYETSVAPATFGQNVFVMQDLTARQENSLVAERYREIQETWEGAGVSVPLVNIMRMIDPNFVLEMGQEGGYEQRSRWNNATFMLGTGWNPRTLSVEEYINLPVIADLPFTRLQFEPDGYQLTSQDVENLEQYVVEPVKFMRGRLDFIASGWYWAGGYTVEYVENWVDTRRAYAVQQALLGLGLPPSVINYAGHVSPNEMPVLTGLSPEVQELVKRTYRPGEQPDLTGLTEVQKEAVKSAYRYVVFRLRLESER